MAGHQFQGGLPPGMQQQMQQQQQQFSAPQQQQQHMYPPQQQQQQQQQMMDPMNPQVTLMLVNVPPNVRTGEQMVVMTPTGQQYMVIVPAGAGPGSQFQIAVPRQDSAPPHYPQMPMHPGMGGMGMPGMQNAAMQQAAMQQAAGRGYGMQPGVGAFGDRGRGAGGRGRGRKRKEKDLNRAPRQPSQYNLFMKTEVARIKQVRQRVAAPSSLFRRRFLTLDTLPKAAAQIGPVG